MIVNRHTTVKIEATCTIPDPVLINAALHAQNGSTQVRIYSEYDCSGTDSRNNIGQIYRVRVNP